MKEQLARQLVNDYVEGWVGSEITRILSPLSDKCYITESHGPTYHGLKEVERWANEWFKTGKVDKWTTDSFFYTENTAFFEWSFTCTVDGKTDSIDGASVVQFKGDKIYHIHEYRMTKPAFDYFGS
jgi:hypothetical protein